MTEFLQEFGCWRFPPVVLGMFSGLAVVFSSCKRAFSLTLQQFLLLEECFDLSEFEINGEVNVSRTLSPVSNRPAASSACLFPVWKLSLPDAVRLAACR